MDPAQQHSGVPSEGPMGGPARQEVWWLRRCGHAGCSANLPDSHSGPPAGPLPLRAAPEPGSCSFGALPTSPTCIPALPPCIPPLALCHRWPCINHVHAAFVTSRPPHSHSGPPALIQPSWPRMSLVHAAFVLCQPPPLSFRPTRGPSATAGRARTRVMQLWCSPILPKSHSGPPLAVRQRSAIAAMHEPGSCRFRHARRCGGGGGVGMLPCMPGCS